MAPATVSIHLVGAEGSSRTVALAAIHRAFPPATVREFRDLAAALAQPAAGNEILLLPSPQPGDIAKASAALDARGLVRWAIVARGGASGSSTSPFVGVGLDDWTAPVLSQTLITASALHALERENARLRGDLRTVSRRFSHDLRTPLNCISTASEALREPDASDDSPQVLFTQSITDSVDEAVALVERLTVLLKATANPQPLQVITMEEIVWGTLQRLESRTLAAGATIVKPDAWPVVQGVPAWIDLIWINLIGNSLKHAGPRPRIELGWDKGEGDVRFWVRDSGKGVPPERRARLFHPFDRLSELNAPRGFGLPIVQRLAELQGGTSGYDPLPAPGGTFFFTLRAA